MRAPNLYEIYAIALLAAAVVLLVRAMPIGRLLALSWRVTHRIAHKVQFRRLIRRHSLIGPWYICRVSVCVLFLVLNGAVLSAQITRTGVGTFSVLFTTLSDAAARARYLALLNLATIYLSPHHHGVADVFGLSLQLFQQIHRVTGLLSLCLLLFSTATALANDPRHAMETSEGQMGLMVRFPHGTLSKLSLTL